MSLVEKIKTFEFYLLFGCGEIEGRDQCLNFTIFSFSIVSKFRISSRTIRLSSLHKVGKRRITKLDILSSYESLLFAIALSSDAL